MEPFQYKLGVDRAGALNFFITVIKEETTSIPVRDDELLYVSSVLAHFANTSSESVDAEHLPSPTNPRQIFERFVLDRSGTRDPDILELGGSQVLFIGGFFREQVRRRHNVNYLDGIGRNLYAEASYRSRDRNRARLLERMSESFCPWARICRNVHRNLAQNAPVSHLLKLSPPS